MGDFDEWDCEWCWPTFKVKGGHLGFVDFNFQMAAVEPDKSDVSPAYQGWYCSSVSSMGYSDHIAIEETNSNMAEGFDN